MSSKPYCECRILQNTATGLRDIIFGPCHDVTALRTALEQIANLDYFRFGTPVQIARNVLNRLTEAR